MATATLERNAERGPVLNQTESGYLGVRHYRINSSNPGDFLTATGLPAIGDSWDNDGGSGYVSAISTLTVKRRTTIIVGGGDGGVGSIPGHGFVRVEYETPGSPSYGGNGNPDDDEVEPTTTYTEIRTSRSQVRIFADILGDPIPPTDKQVIVTELAIHTFKQNMTWFTAYQNVKGLVNDAAIDIPPPYGLSGNQTIAQYRALMLDVEMRTVRSGLIEVVFVIGLADSSVGWAYVYQDEDTNGNPVPPSFLKDIYEEATFDTSTLWSIS